MEKKYISNWQSILLILACLVMILIGHLYISKTIDKQNKAEQQHIQYEQPLKGANKTGI